MEGNEGRSTDDDVGDGLDPLRNQIGDRFDLRGRWRFNSSIRREPSSTPFHETIERSKEESQGGIKGDYGKIDRFGGALGPLGDRVVR